jgi:transcriptional regulator with XRE-family HTH domain
VGPRPWTAAFGGRLKEARLRAALSRAEVAAELRVSQESVRRWEQGGSKPSAAAVAAYLRAVGSDVVPAEPLVPDDHGEPAAPTAPDVGQLVQRRRLQLGLTQVEAARLIGVAQPTLAGWEIGRAHPGRDLAIAIAAFLDRPFAQVEGLLHQPLTVEMSDWPTFGRIIGERRLTLQLERAQLAARMHVSARTIAAWELGEKVPNNSHLRRLAEVLSVEPTVLVSALPERLPDSELGRLIYRRQRLLGLSRDDIAVACDVTPPTVGRWIWGQHAPTESNVSDLARALELDQRIVRTAVDVDHPGRARTTG